MKTLLLGDDSRRCDGYLEIREYGQSFVDRGLDLPVIPTARPPRKGVRQLAFRCGETLPMSLIKGFLSAFTPCMYDSQRGRVSKGRGKWVAVIGTQCAH